MLKRILLPLLLVLLVLAGCSDKKNIVAPEENRNGGQMMIQIDKENAPVGIIKVVAVLTRQGHNTITGELNLTSDSSAALTLQNIAVGPWHLKIEAKDSVGTVKYRGEKDVVISEGMITQVSLTLEPVLTGVGGISIKVGWGSAAPALWTNYPGNPVLRAGTAPWNSNGPMSSSIIYENGLYHMWYSALGSGSISIGYATSEDGNSWSNYSGNPVMISHLSGSWDSRISMGSVIKDDGLYRLYYTGWVDASQSGPMSAGLATSTDGKNWTRRSTPVLTGSTATNDDQIVPRCVIRKDALLYMYYNYKTASLDNWKVGLATSSDGINWKKYQGNPVLTVTYGWEEPGVGSPSIITYNNKYYMVYQNCSYSTLPGFGLAESADGINWVKKSPKPILTAQNPSSSWQVSRVLYPTLIQAGSEFRIYYCGSNQANNYFQIGYCKNSKLQ